MQSATQGWDTSMRLGQTRNGPRLYLLEIRTNICVVGFLRTWKMLSRYYVTQNENFAMYIILELVQDKEIISRTSDHEDLMSFSQK